MFRAAVVLCAVVLGTVPASASDPSSADPFLAMGVRQYRDGDFEAAVFSLDTAVRRLTARSAPPEPLSLAYVYLGATYVALDHESAAKGKFRQALELDRQLRLEADQFTPKVIGVFETQRLKIAAARQRRSSTKTFALGAAGAAAAIGAAVLGRSGPPPPANRAPTMSIAVNPAGRAVAGVTTLTFLAQGDDPDGDTLRCDWDFGDGRTGSGTTVRLRYESEGTFRVVLTASDGRGGDTAVSTNVTARSLTGVWVDDRNLIYTLIQSGTTLSGNLLNMAGPGGRVSGILFPPRGVRWSMTVSETGQERYSFLGAAETWLDAIEGVHYDERTGEGLPIVLRRR